jgi:hypothetical protein
VTRARGCGAAEWSGRAASHCLEFLDVLDFLLLEFLQPLAAQLNSPPTTSRAGCVVRLCIPSLKETKKERESHLHTSFPHVPPHMTHEGSPQAMSPRAAIVVIAGVIYGLPTWWWTSWWVHI